MPNNRPNLYSLPTLPGTDPQTRRVFQDMVDQLNYLTGEVDRLRGEIPNTLKPFARKENPQKGIISIPGGGSGQDGAIRVNSDGVIVSYVNPSDGIFPYVDIVTAQSVSTELTTLHTFTIPAGTLAKEGDSVRVEYAGTFAGNGNSKRIRVSIGGAGLADSTQAQNGGGWNYDLLYTRISPTVILATGQIIWNFATPSGGFVNVLLASLSGTANVSNLNTTDVVMLVEGQGTTTGDVIQSLSHIDFDRARTVRTA